MKHALTFAAFNMRDKMKIKFITILGLLFLIGCSKSSVEYFELSKEKLKNNQPDLALKDLGKLLEKYPNDSLASNALYKMSTIHLNWHNDLSSGFDVLEKLVKNYPKSKQGKQAKIEIDEFPDFVLNKTESLRKKEMTKEAVDHLMFLIENYSKHKLLSKAQYMLGDIYMNDLRDFNTAIQEYRKVIETYSGSEQEPHALFMIGYVYANILNDTKSAKIEYEEFLSRFPKHELSPSVKFEIDYLGKNVDEIPALKHITS